MKKRMSTIIGALVVLCLATSCFVGSTFAKYTSTVSGSGVVTTDIAKWAFDIGGLTDLTKEEAQTVTFTTGTVTNTGATEETIFVDSTKVKMAPGSKGSFSLKITNNSDVTAKVKATITSVSLTITPKNGGEEEKEEVATHPFTYSTSENGDYKVIPDDGLVICNEEEIDYANGSNEKTIKIYWDWAFEGNNDKVDTKIGIAQANGDTITWTVNVEVVLTQVD